MSAVLSWPFLTICAAGIGTLYLISYLLEYREKPGAKWFILTLVGQAIFCFAYAAGLTVTTNRTLRHGLEVLAFIGLSWLGVPFLAFALGYTGRGKLLESWGFKLLLAFPIGSTLLFPLNVYHELFWADFEIDPIYGVATASYTLKPLALFGILGAGVVVGIATVILLDTVLSYGPLYRKEALAVALSPVPPIAGMFPWLFGFGPAPQLNTVALGLLPHVVFDAYAFVGSGMFEFHPATNRAAERSALDDLRSPVLIIEESGRIVDLNQPAAELLGLDSQQAVTQPISSVLDGNIQFEDVETTTETLRLSTRQAGQRVEFRVEPAPLTDSSGNHVGYTLLFQDVTEQIQREERLGVLNRVLRHNLRNDLTVIRGYMDEAKQRSDDSEIVELLAKAGEKASELVAAGETAREIEATIGAKEVYRTEIDLESRLTQLKAGLTQEFPHASVEIDCKRERIETDPDLLDSVLGELLENAIRHNDSDERAVTISATTGENEIELMIADNGPGIPDHEIETLQHGQETALEHGSGLGLWLVKWGVMRLGGDLTFESDDDGTTVIVRLPEQTK